MARVGPTVVDIEGFVVELEADAQSQIPHLNTEWDIIVLLQDSLIFPGTRAIRPFDQYIGIHPDFVDFAHRAYKWLRIQHACGTTRTAIAKIGHTKPGIMREVREGLMPHELEQKQRRKREQQMFPGSITSLTDFMAADGAIKRLVESTPHPDTTADIPDTFAAMVPYVRQMAEALADRSDILDGPNSKPVKAVNSTSGPVFEHEAWNLRVNTACITPLTVLRSANQRLFLVHHC
ncbi:hypothetical protein B0T20DRAFT_349373 [Sordaria brevicollis]|uniref:Uncharacterized protein n=1 Tax=Sordaria brevicollis TaxID=83679 RepID=A0AAE0UCZ5_SORBR|nr:hypothetical protein B0T20DRAFT_349373 [Sordaria brevicollis]